MDQDEQKFLRTQLQAMMDGHFMVMKALRELQRRLGEE